jgi:hypothetical protein
MSEQPPARETFVDLPAEVGESFEVFINGVPQSEGRDYDLRGRTLVFQRPLSSEGKLSPLRWLALFLGAAGTYRKHESVDVIYDRDGQRLVAVGLQPRALEPDIPGG